jgi:hypothetical protein
MIKAAPATIEALADSLDEMFLDLAELKEQNEVLFNMITERDKMNLLMVKHVESLVREKEVLLMHMGLSSLQKKVVETLNPVESFKDKTISELYEFYAKHSKR